MKFSPQEENPSLANGDHEDFGNFSYTANTMENNNIMD